MAVPSTFEELAAAVEAETALFEERSTDLHDRVNARAMNRMYAARLRALIPPAPEPIKVGDWVRGVDGTEGEVLGGPWDDNGDQTCAVRMDNGEGIDLWCVADLTRVTDEQPEPEPDRSPGGFGVFDPKKFVRIQDGAS